MLLPAVDFDCGRTARVPLPGNRRPNVRLSGSEPRNRTEESAGDQPRGQSAESSFDHFTGDIYHNDPTSTQGIPRLAVANHSRFAGSCKIDGAKYRTLPFREQDSFIL